MGGISVMLLLEKGMPGIECSKQVDCVGGWPSGTYITFDDVEGPQGEPHRGGEHGLHEDSYEQTDGGWGRASAARREDRWGRRRARRWNDAIESADKPLSPPVAAERVRARLRDR